MSYVNRITTARFASLDGSEQMQEIARAKLEVILDKTEDYKSKRHVAYLGDSLFVIGCAPDLLLAAPEIEAKNMIAVRHIGINGNECMDKVKELLRGQRIVHKAINTGSQKVIVIDVAKNGNADKINRMHETKIQEGRFSNKQIMGKTPLTR